MTLVYAIVAALVLAAAYAAYKNKAKVSSAFAAAVAAVKGKLGL
jgi:hypothetical protein